MSTPEFTPDAFLIKSNVYAHDIRDAVQDVVWVSEGKKIAKNDSKSFCGGGKPIGECTTSTDMAKQIIGRFMEGINPEPVDETNPKLIDVGQPVVVDSSCGDCDMLCHAYGKVIDGKPSEKIRFMYGVQIHQLKLILSQGEQVNSRSYLPLLKVNIIKSIQDN